MDSLKKEMLKISQFKSQEKIVGSFLHHWEWND